MPFIKKFRSRKDPISELAPFQQRWLEYRGEEIPYTKPTSFKEIYDQMAFQRLCDGKKPYLKPRVWALPPWTLWKRYGEKGVKPYGYEKWPKKNQKLGYSQIKQNIIRYF